MKRALILSGWEDVFHCGGDDYPHTLEKVVVIEILEEHRINARLDDGIFGTGSC